MAALMKAIRWHSRCDVRLDDIPTPKAQGGSGVLLAVEACGICGTDLEEVRRGPFNIPIDPDPVSGMRAPITLGHEIVGRVVEAGPESPLAIGERAAVWPIIPCTECRECVQGAENRCERMIALGMTADGGMAEFLAVDSKQCCPVPDSVPIERALLIEPIAVALRALARQPLRDRRLAIVGAGSLGLALLETALHLGASEVTVLSRSKSSRDAALRLGAQSARPLAEARQLAVDVSVEATGVEAGVVAAVHAARPGGTVIVVGAYTRPVRTPLRDVVLRGLVLEGSAGHLRTDFWTAARLVASGALASGPREVDSLSLIEGTATLMQRDHAARKSLVAP
jgi:(R,R)-butanediol dehydrogenase / meso-butanediol dehydrogenase / diacetyl reductase